MTDTPSTLGIVPVMPSKDLARDLDWYRERVGFEHYFGDDGYAGLRRGTLEFHLQLHRGTDEDPFPGGSVMKIFVADLVPYFEELQERGTITIDVLRKHTPWGTHEFGFYDPSGNAVFFVQDT